MSNERFKKAKLDLKKLIPSSHFRTIESFAMRKAPSETKVELELKDGFMKELDFKVPWDGKLYAYARQTNEFLGFLKENGLTEGELTAIYIQDWDTAFNMIFETTNNKKEISFFASREEVKELLENCCRIPSQR